MVAPKVVQVIQQVVEWEGRISDFISGPTPDNALAASAQESYRRGCDRYSAAPGFIQGLGPTGQTLGRVCRQYLNDQGYSEPVKEVPFQGGQCPALYQFNVAYTSFNAQDSPSNSNSGFIVQGPISGYSVGGGNGVNPFIRFTYGDGRAPTTGNLQGDSAATQGPAVTGVTLVRLDGPDNCGNPPEDLLPGPNPAPDPGPTFEPTVDPDFPSFPRFREPDTYVDPVEGPVPWPDINIEIGLGGGGGGGDFPPTGPGVAGQPSDSGDGGEVEGEAPAGEVLLGLLVELLVIPPFARQVQNSLVPAYIGTAYVSMGWEGQLDLDNSGQFARAIEYYIAPLNATHWRVTAAIGYNLRVTPYYTETILEV